jgi:putative ABC transport system permease protein
MFSNYIKISFRKFTRQKFYSLLNIFGRTSYTLEQKSTEYGIRKVFGASVSRLFFIASREFLIRVVIAFLTSVPLAWLSMKQRLSTFSYHTDLSLVVFQLAGLIAIIIAMTKVSYNARKVGMINPARTLRGE